MARGREVERVRASVDGVAASLGEPSMLEVVDECDHRAAVDSERFAQCLLGLALVCGEMAEHPEMARMQVEGGEALGEAAMPVRAQLYQQEARATAQIPRRGRLPAGGFPWHPADDTAHL